MHIITAMKKSGGGGLYQAYIESEACPEGFRAQVTRVILMKPPRPTGVEVAHDPLPVHVAETKERAEQIAEAAFKAFVKLGTLGL